MSTSTWSVMLAGAFKAYEPHISLAIEEAYQRGDDEAAVTVRGTKYLITFTPRTAMKQKLASDPTKQRAVRRQDNAPAQVAAQPPARQVAAPAPAPAPILPPAPPTAAAPPAAAAPGPLKRKLPANFASRAGAATKGHAGNDDENQDDHGGSAPASAPKPVPPKTGNKAARPSPAPAASSPSAAGSSDSGGGDGGGSGAALMAPGSNNFRIHQMLVELAESEKVRGDIVKTNAYTKAAIAVKGYSKVITSGKTAQKEISGVGKKMGEKIDELLSTGSLARIERDRADAELAVLKDLQRVSGIGIKFAQELKAEHGIADVQMLATRTDLLNHEQTIGLRHLHDFEARIPREEMRRLERTVAQAAAAHDPPLQMTVCGSYRRGRADSGDIDCLLCHPSYLARSTGDADVPGWLASLVEALKADGFITDVISLGKKKCHAVCRLPPPADCTATAPPSSSSASSTSPSAVAPAASAPSSAEQAAPAPSMVRLPSAKEVQMRRAGLLTAKKPQTDLFAQWKKTGLGGHSTASGGGGSVTSGNPPLPPSGGAAATASGADSSYSPGAFDAGDVRRFRRLDLRLVPFECYHASTLYFTGSDEHNKLMRNNALAKGHKLSEYGLFVNTNGEAEKADARPIPVQSEEDIFRLLDMAYATPEQRDI